MDRLLVDPGGSWESEEHVSQEIRPSQRPLSQGHYWAPVSFWQPPLHSLPANTLQGTCHATSLDGVLSEGTTGVVPVIGLGWQSLATKTREKRSKGLWGQAVSWLETDRVLPFLFSCAKISTYSLDWLSTRCVVQGGLKVTPFCLWLPKAAVPGAPHPALQTVPLLLLCAFVTGRVADISWLHRLG